MYRNYYIQASQMADMIQSGALADQKSAQRKSQQEGLMNRISSRVEEDSGFDVTKYISNMRSTLKKEAPAVEGGSVTGMAVPDIEELPEGTVRPKSYEDVVYKNTKLEEGDVDYGLLAKGIAEAANELGMNPEDLATIISYETAGTFNPSKAGPTTKWGQHKGLIQFGEVQAKEYGVDWNNPYSSQLGRDGAIVRYFKDRGFKEGMGLLDAYSIVNAGAPGLYNRSDESAGGAPGTVRDKVRTQMAGHKAKARRLIEDYL